MKSMKLLKTLRQIAKKSDNKGYLESWKDNIYGEMASEHYDMFYKASGNELDKKAKAIHSSSMLAYNFFSWIDEDQPFIFDDTTYTHVEFEDKMKTLKGSPVPANLDVVLTSSDKKTKLFIESKFTEHLGNSKFAISPSYSDNDKNLAGIDWSKLIKFYNKKYKDDKKHYYDGIKQNICHLVALNNYAYMLKQDNIDKTINILFTNLIFDPQRDSFPNDFGRYEDYIKLLEKFSENYKDCVSDKCVDEIQSLSYSKLWLQMKPCIKDEKRIKYLEDRYISQTNY